MPVSFDSCVLSLECLCEHWEHLFRGVCPVSDLEVHGVFTVRNRLQFCVCMAVLGLVMGCSNAETAKLSKPTKPVTWPELAALRAPEVNMAITMNAQQNNIAGVKKAIEDVKLQELVDKFNSAPVPKEFDSPARQKAKEKVSEDYKNMIALAKSGSNKDIKAAVMTSQESISKLTDPELK